MHTCMPNLIKKSVTVSSSHYLAYIQSRPFSCSTPRKRKFSGWLDKRNHSFKMSAFFREQGWPHCPHLPTRHGVGVSWMPTSTISSFFCKIIALNTFFLLNHCIDYLIFVILQNFLHKKKTFFTICMKSANFWNY